MTYEFCILDFFVFKLLFFMSIFVYFTLLKCTVFNRIKVFRLLSYDIVYTIKSLLLSVMKHCW